MTDGRNQLERRCDPERHDEHLCYIVALGFHLTDEQEYIALTEGPRFRCDHCGRTARNEANLCVPAELQAAAP